MRERLEKLGATDFELSPGKSGHFDVTVDLVACGTDRACLSPAVVSSASTIGPYGIWSDDESDLGHFVFLVD